MLYLKCQGQVVSIDKDERFADKYINANTVHWEFCERWNGMTITAQFTQDGNTYNVLVDEVTFTTTLPNEIVAGEVDISAFGVHPETGVRITTVPVKKKIDKSGFIGDGETVIPPTPDLYAQLIAKIDDVGEIPVEEIEKAVNAYMDENHIQTGATPEQAAQIEANKEAIENYVPPVTSVNGMTGDVVIEAGGEADSVRWENVTGKPSAYPPAEHEHTWNDVKEKPSEFPPESHSHDWSDVTGKPETYPPSEHEHSYNDLNDKPTIPVVPKFLPNPYALTINGKEYDGSEEVNVVISAGGGEADSVAWSNVTGKPSTYPPESHTHAEYATTGELNQLSQQKANKAGWTAGKNVVTDAGGNLVTEEKPTVPSTLPNPYSLTINGQTYDGSKAVNMTVNGLPAGGAAGQVLSKSSDADNEVQWIDPSGGGMELELLWSNPSPTSTFGEQSITPTKGLGDYEMLLFEYTGAETNISACSFARKYSRTFLFWGSGYSNKLAAREMKITGNTIWFGPAYYGGQTITNSTCVPVNIYGVKGVTIE